MGKVLFGLSASLDGFIADKHDDVSQVFAWMGRAMEHFYEVAGDEFHLSIAHVLLGEGVRLFDHLGASPIYLKCIRTLETPGATHLSFRVVK